ncbi:MAG: amidohydrolase [Candidatus Heimdallarchaeota archaeon]
MVEKILKPELRVIGMLTIIGGTLIDGTGRPPVENPVIVVSRSKILKVGTEMEVDIPKTSKIIDTTGKTIIPSFIDSHTHFLLMGIRSLSHLDLSQTKSIAEVLKKIGGKLRTFPEGAWLYGHGWDESNWQERRYPTKKDLDSVSPDNPISLTPMYGHLMVVNSRALKLAGITQSTPEPKGGRIDRDPSTKEATGILREEAMGLIGSLKPPTSKEEYVAGIQKACEITLSWGCASIHELGLKAAEIQAYQLAWEKGILNVRSYLMPDVRDTESMLDGLEVLGIKTSFGNEFLRLGPIKIYADGSMGARTAVFYDPYSDDSSSSGLLTISPKTLEERVIRAHKLGIQVAIHAIGDRGIDVALDAIEAALTLDPRKNHRHRIEHCEILNHNQIQRIKRLEIIPSMQPNFVGEWGQSGGMYEQRIGPRIANNNPYRKLLDAGVVVCFGSDCGYCPPWPFNPLYGLWAAVNHPIKKYQISIPEAVKCYTLNGAYASFEETLKGSIEPGKFADIAILSEDLNSIAPDEIRNVKVDLTMVEGLVKWKR